MNFNDIVLEQLTFNELALQAEKDNLEQWRLDLDKMIGKEVCSLGAIAKGVNFLGPWILIGKNTRKVGGVSGGWIVRDKATNKITLVSTPRIYPVSYMTLNQLSGNTRETFGDIVNEL